MTRYVVVQSSESGSSWRHYLCGWHGDVPVWYPTRDDALKLDEETARQLVDKFDDRYRRVVRHSIEELSP